MLNQQQNLEIMDIESDDFDIIFWRLKIVFSQSVLQLIVSCGLGYLHIGLLQFFVIDIIIGCYSLLLQDYLVNQRMYWCYDQNKEVIKSQQQHIETTNNFLTRLQLVISVTVSVTIIYTLMAYILIPFQQDRISNLYKYLTIAGFFIQILIQIIVLSNNSYFCKSPNVLRLSIYFQSLILTILIFLSGIRSYQVQSLPSQLQTSDFWIEWNTLLQLPTLVLIAISMLFNYIGNKRAYSLFGTLFLILSILHTIMGCLTIRNAQFWTPENDQLPLRALHQQIISNLGCSKYYQNSNCLLVNQVQVWEENNEIACLSDKCKIEALNFIKILHLELGLTFIFEATMLFMMTYAMYTVAVKYQITKLLNPITQKIIILLFFIILIIGAIYFFVLPIPEIKTQPSMKYQIESDLLPEFDQKLISKNNIINIQSQQCKSLNKWLDIQDIEAMNCESTCEQYEFIVGVKVENGQLFTENNSLVKTYSQEYTHQFYKQVQVDQQIAMRGNKSQLVQAFDNVFICSDSPSILLSYEFDQVKQQQHRVLIEQKRKQIQIMNDISIEFRDILSQKKINKGQFRVYKQYFQCSNLNNQPFLEQSVQDPNLYNIKQGQELTITFQNEKYYNFCGNYVVTERSIIVTPLKKNKNKVTLILSWESEQGSNFYLMMDQQIGQSKNCQAGGFFTGCSHIKTKQTNRYSMLQIQEHISNAVIFLSDFETIPQYQSVTLLLNLYTKNGKSSVRQIYYKKSDILKIACFGRGEQITFLQEVENTNLFSLKC